MNPKRKKRLLLVVGMATGFATAIGLMLYALQENLNLFYSPSQIVAGEVPEGARIRAGGMVKEGSVQRDPNSLKVRFDVTDYAATVTIEFDRSLPDLFREGQGIVAMGRLDADGLFVADEVLAKHDENYMPPEISDALKKQAASYPALNGGTTATGTSP